MRFVFLVFSVVQIRISKKKETRLALFAMPCLCMCNMLFLSVLSAPPTSTIALRLDLHQLCSALFCSLRASTQYACCSGLMSGGVGAHASLQDACVELESVLESPFITVVLDAACVCWGLISEAVIFHISYCLSDVESWYVLMYGICRETERETERKRTLRKTINWNWLLTRP